MKTIVLDFDDFSVMRSRPDLLTRLKSHYPNLKISMFTILYDYEYEMSPLRASRDYGLKFIKENSDWIEFIPHGIFHQGPEFESMTKDGMRAYIEGAEMEFAKDGIKIVKGFKAPHWMWNQDVVDVLDEYGWFGGVDRNQPDMPTPKRFYRYNLSIDEQYWSSDEEVWKLHGHMTPPSKNNLDHCFMNLMNMPQDAEFKFVSEMIEEK